MRLHLILIAILLVLSSCQTQRPKPEQTEEPSVTESKKPKPFEVKAKPGEVLIDHGFFLISYNPKTKGANWVTYEIKAENLKKKQFKRQDHFMPDPELVKRGIPYAKPSDYAGTGYDRGHLAPAADFAWNPKASDQTFLMSNMQPQSPGLNRRAWKALEERVRRWACGEKHVRVVTGPIPGEEIKKIGNGVSVPRRFFKVVLDETEPRKMIGFIYSQNDKTDVYKERVVSVVKLEELTGQSFFKGADSKIKAASNPSSWKEATCKGSR